MVCNNDFTYGLVVYCPVVRDDVQGTAGAYDFVINVKINTPGEITCTALSFDADRDPIQVVTESVTGGDPLFGSLLREARSV
jgi:hypothetical protein